MLTSPRLRKNIKYETRQEDFLWLINPLVPELFFLILAHYVYKMWIIQEPNTLELWYKLHFEEEKTESM